MRKKIGEEEIEKLDRECFWDPIEREEDKVVEAKVEMIKVIGFEREKLSGERRRKKSNSDNERSDKKLKQ